MTKAERNIQKNERRRRKINLVLSVTGDSKLATLLRDRSDEYIQGYLDSYKKKLKKKKKKVVEREIEEDIESFEDFKRPEKEDKNTKRRRLYKEARDAGYTPEEAQKLRGKAQKNFDNVLQFNKVVNNQSRYEQWATWGKEVGKIEKKLKQALKDNRSASVIFDLEQKQNSIYPKWIQDQVTEINERNEYDKNSSYGWNVVYYYYTEGGTIEFWESFFMADPLNPNIYRARGNLKVSVENRQRRLK